MKNNKLITILIILVLCLGCFFVYTSLDSKNEVTKEEKNEVKKESLTVSEKAIVNYLFKTVSIGFCGGGVDYKINPNDIIYYDNLTDEQRFSMAYRFSNNSMFETNRSSLTTISKDELLKAYKYFYGDLNFNLPNTLSYRLSGFELDSYGENLYLLTNMGTHDDELYFDVVYVVEEIDEDTFEVYLKEALSDSKVKIKISSMNVSDEEKLEAISNDLDKFIQYRFTFKTKEDHYVFSNIKRIN